MDEFDVLGQGKAQLFDGKDSLSHNATIPKSKTVFQRISGNFEGEKISNTRTAFSSAVSSEGGQLSCSIYVRFDEGEAEVYVTNISEDVYAVLPVKRIARGTRGNDFRTVQFNTESEGLRDHVKEMIDKGSENQTQAVFTDSDIEDGVIYEYAAILYSRSGVPQLSGSRFLESRNEPEGLVDLQMEIEEVVAADNEDTSGVFTKDVTMSGILKRQEDDVDKILNSIFGDNRQLFNAELSEIKDASNLLYGIRVHKIDTRTGEFSFVGSFRAFKQNKTDDTASSDIPNFFKVRFTDNITAGRNYVYKIDPYIVPPASVLDKVEEKLKKSVLEKNRSRSQLNRMLVSKLGIKKANRVSSVGSKYASGLGRKGVIRSPKAAVQNNYADLFFDGITGDIKYFSVDDDDENLSISNFEILNSKIGVVRTLDTVKGKFTPKKIIKINFDVEDLDPFIDFYVILRRDNKNVGFSIDGAVHSNDFEGTDDTESSEYTYLSDVGNKIGLYRYYAVGFAKSGALTDAVSLGAIFIEGDE
jgi:hypothetical protein